LLKKIGFTRCADRDLTRETTRRPPHRAKVAWGLRSQDPLLTCPRQTLACLWQSYPDLQFTRRTGWPPDRTRTGLLVSGGHELSYDARLRRQGARGGDACTARVEDRPATRIYQPFPV